MCSERRTTRRIKARNSLNKRNIDHIRLNCTIRRTLGNDVNASCGQLRMSHKKTLESQ